MLFALLKASLHKSAADTCVFEMATREDWDHCYSVATRQGVLALAWEGIHTLPVPVHPYKQLKFKWAMSVEKFEKIHEKYCETVQSLQQFYSEHGIVALQLKGVGFSSYYNIPAHREGGDIDIYTYSADISKMSHKEANALSDALMKMQGVQVDDEHSYKHTNFHFNGIPIENHKCFLNIESNPKFLGKLDALLFRIMNPVEEEFYDGKFKLTVPSNEFNTIFIACHAFQHYGSGIALHHLYDWSVILRKYGLQLHSEVTEVYFLRALAAITYLSNKYLGTDVDISHMPAGYEKLAEEILKEMLHPRFSGKVLPKNPFARMYTKTVKVFVRARLARKVLGSSVLKTILSSFKSYVSDPQYILNRGDKQ